jgi:hypothetical protein
VRGDSCGVFQREGVSSRGEQSAENAGRTIGAGLQLKLDYLTGSQRLIHHSTQVDEIGKAIRWHSGGQFDL